MTYQLFTKCSVIKSEDFKLSIKEVCGESSLWLEVDKGIIAASPTDGNKKEPCYSKREQQ